MMKFKNIYYCCQCHSIFAELENLLFVEENSSRGFCSEDCIEKFYDPLVEHFASIIDDKRQDIGIDDDALAIFDDDLHYQEKILNNPDELWRHANDLEEDLFILVKEFQDEQYGHFYGLTFCYLYEKEVSFILAQFYTYSEELVDFFRGGEEIKCLKDWIVSPSESLLGESVLEREVDSDFLQMIEQKKGALLAEIISNRKESDIPLEAFAHYEDYFISTYKSPDEICRIIDDDGDDIYCYIKAHDREEVSFYYYILCLFPGDRTDFLPEHATPIIGFPSVDGETYGNYLNGVLVKGSLKN